LEEDENKRSPPMRANGIGNQGAETTAKHERGRVRERKKEAGYIISKTEISAQGSNH
jgi:hypothetical protein